MALLNDVVFAACLFALGFGPILYSTKVLRNDTSFYEPDWTLYSHRSSKESMSSIPLDFSRLSTLQSTTDSAPEALVHLSISDEDTVSTISSPFKDAREDISQSDTLTQHTLCTNKNPLHVMKTSDFTIPVSSKSTEVHTRAHLLHSNNVVGPDADIDTVVVLVNALTQQTNDQENSHFATHSNVKATTTASFPAETSTPMNGQSEIFISTNSLRSIPPDRGPLVHKSFAKTMLEVMQASLLILVGVLIGISCSYSSIMLSCLRDHAQRNEDSVVQGLRQILSQSLEEYNVEIPLKREDPADPETFQATYHPNASPTLSPSPMMHPAGDYRGEEADVTLRQCENEAVGPIVVSYEDIDTPRSSRADVEASSPTILSMHFNSDHVGDETAEQSHEEVAVPVYGPDREAGISDVSVQVDEEAGDFDVAVHEGASESKDQCAEVINPIGNTAPLPSDETLSDLDDESSHPAVPADDSGAEGTMMNPLNEEITHFFMTSRYVPPHKRASDPQAKDHLPRKVVTVPSASSLAEPEVLPKSRQFQYDFFKGFLENFGQGTGTLTSASDGPNGAAPCREIDWRHRESKSLLTGRWHFSRLAAHLDRVVEEDKGAEAYGGSAMQNVAVMDDGNLDTMALASSCDTDLDGSLSKKHYDSAGSGSSCPLAEGSLSGNRFRVLEMADAGGLTSDELEGKEKRSNPTPLQIVPSRVLLLRNEMKPKIRSSPEAHTTMRVDQGDEGGVRPLALRDFVRTTESVNQTDESDDF